MTTIEISVDTHLFERDVVLRTAHRYTGEFFVDVEKTDVLFIVRLTAKSGSIDLLNLDSRFRNDLLDDLLRARVDESTRELRDALTHAALREAQPKVDGLQA